MNSGDTIQIEAPDFDPDIDDISPTTIDQELNNQLTQGTASPTPKTTESKIELQPLYHLIITWPCKKWTGQMQFW